MLYVVMGLSRIVARHLDRSQLRDLSVVPRRAVAFGSSLARRGLRVGYGNEKHQCGGGTGVG